jgi:hypothetical protein
MRARSLVLGGVVLTAAIGLLAGGGLAADKKGGTDGKKVRAITVKAAELFEKKDEEGGKKEAATMPKDADLDDIMLIYKLRTNKGIGIGVQPIKGVSDGIESFIDNLQKRVPTPKILDDNNDDLVRACYISAAVAEIIKDRCPVKQKKGNQDPADWKKWSDDMYKESLALAEAIKSKKAPAIKEAAKKLNATCVSCHSPFKKND